MPVTAKNTAKPAEKQLRAAAVAGSSLRGRLVRVRTNEELIADMKAYGREVRKTKESAIAFLQSAGILDNAGELAEPYRAK